MSVSHARTHRIDIILVYEVTPVRIDPEDFRRHYAMLSDQALFALNRAELIETAQACYDAEVARRTAARQAEATSAHALPAADREVELDEEFEMEPGPPPDWLDDAACACTFSFSQDTPDLDKVRDALRAARIPCYITVNEIEERPTAARLRTEYAVMVPGALNLHAMSVLDRDLFNADQEENWRTHLAALPDEDLGKLNPNIFCAGLLDRAARLKKVYEEEVARRKA